MVKGVFPREKHSGSRPVWNRPAFSCQTEIINGISTKLTTELLEGLPTHSQIFRQGTDQNGETVPRNLASVTRLPLLCSPKSGGSYSGNQESVVLGFGYHHETF